MTRSVTVLTVCLGLLVAACSRQDAPQPTSPVEAPERRPPAAVGYACESGRTIAVVYLDAQTARLTYDGRDYLLTSAVSASGARYAGEGLEWRTASRGAQESAVLTRLDPDGGVVIERCSRPVAAAAPPPSGAPCAAAELRLTVEGGDAGMGHRLTTLALRNAGAAACTVSGYPTVTLLDDKGQALTSVRAVPSTAGYLVQGRASMPVAIRPGQAAWFDLAWSIIPHEDQGETVCPSARTVRVVAPGAAAPIDLPLAFTPCGGQVEVSPVRPVAEVSTGPAPAATN